MKRFFSLFLTAALAGAGFVSCSDDPEDQPVVPTDVEKVSGIETNYVLGLHEYLEITPDIELSNENESISYEWSIDYETVSTERNLSFKCDELLNDVNCYFKASSSTGAKIAEFKLSVTSPYDKGLLLLSQTGDGAMLTFKRLDIMATPASPYAFKDNNPTLSLGKEALALCWKGEGLTNLGNSIKDQDTEIILSSGNPTKVYVLNTNDMKVKTEITYNGEGEFHPNYVISSSVISPAFTRPAMEPKMESRVLRSPSPSFSKKPNRIHSVHKYPQGLPRSVRKQGSRPHAPGPA